VISIFRGKGEDKRNVVSVGREKRRHDRIAFPNEKKNEKDHSFTTGQKQKELRREENEELKSPSGKRGRGIKPRIHNF